MQIEIWSDVMCPFCYIGKRRLESALKDVGLQNEVEITWKSFLLNPEMKTDPSKNSLDYLAEIKGWSMEQVIQMTEQVAGIAAAEGLDYRMEDTKVANAMDAHRIIQLAKRHNLGNEMEERLFRAYFTEGANIADHVTLIRLAEEVGIPNENAAACLSEQAFTESIHNDIRESQELGVRGVPFFVFNRQYAISGAQPKELFVETLEKCRLEAE
ncbi:MAG: DsbA family oxidoreductase [Lunatimonas sp.]|uniref:DsbA family oxidoreductase n=1 Tax=Lunatimonas sp. TaxID=2060141 RepID=UPI00263B7242|nr:DsbA family oxidoreductase [Lunatimonas sp.]MCC5937912.1 DsbA family oxidoreductase [Lunatimonas sp.]